MTQDEQDDVGEGVSGLKHEVRRMLGEVYLEYQRTPLDDREFVLDRAATRISGAVDRSVRRFSDSKLTGFKDPSMLVINVPSDDDEAIESALELAENIKRKHPSMTILVLPPDLTIEGLTAEQLKRAGLARIRKGKKP